MLQLFELVVLYNYNYNYYHIYIAILLALALPGAVNELWQSKMSIDRESLSEHHGIGIDKIRGARRNSQVGPPGAVKTVK